MPAVTLNGVVFNADVFTGVTSPTTAKRAPQKVTPIKDGAVGETVEAANGYETALLREATPGVVSRKRAWRLVWEQVPEGTRAAVEAVNLLNTTFTAILPYGTFTVQVRPDTFEQEEDRTVLGGYGIDWNLSIEIVKVGV